MVAEIGAVFGHGRKELGRGVGGVPGCAGAVISSLGSLKGGTS